MNLRTRLHRPRAALLGILLGIMGATTLMPARAWALNRDVRTVLIFSGYGMVGGTVLGALTLPLTQNVRTMFVGTSLGLYLGLVVGVYYVLDKDDSLRLRSGAQQGDDGDLRFTDRELRLVASSGSSHSSQARAAGDQLARVEIPVLRF